jgi:hypothetical protein
MLALSLPPDTDCSGSIGVITMVRLWRRVGPISTTGNLVVYEDCYVFATVGSREVGRLNRVVGGSSRLDAQFLRIGQEQATVDPQRLALRSRRNMLIHRSQVEYAKLTQSRAVGPGGADDLVGGALGLIADVGAPVQQVVSIKLQGVRAKLTIQGEWGTPACEWLRRALGDRLVAVGFAP